MASHVDDAATLIRQRLDELASERKQLEKALTNLTGDRSTSRRTSKRRQGKGTRRRRRGGTRSDEAVRQVQQNPGIRASEIAKRMGIKPNYLYRVLADLEKEGKISKKGREYHPAGETEPASS